MCWPTPKCSWPTPSPTIMHSACMRSCISRSPSVRKGTAGWSDGGAEAACSWLRWMLWLDWSGRCVSREGCWHELKGAEAGCFWLKARLREIHLLFHQVLMGRNSCARFPLAVSLLGNAHKLTHIWHHAA